jgi:hypothetical protein
MYTQHHSLSDLFSQLGLPNDSQAIDHFIQKHHMDSVNQTLEALPVWTTAQKQFLIDARSEDADWAEPVDELDMRMHQ